MSKKELTLPVFRLFVFLSLLMLCQTHSADLFKPTLLSHNKKLFMGSIKFPEAIITIPNLRIYYKGQIITCESNNETKNLAFSIAEESKIVSFYLLITEKITYASEKNTIKYLKAIQPYKIYKLTLDNENDTETWAIESIAPNLYDNKIPDNTIIVCCNPEYIDTIKGGTTIMLPDIIIRNDILQLVGSEKQLHEHLNELLLASLDYDTIHARIQQEIKPNYQQKTIVALTA